MSMIQLEVKKFWFLLFYVKWFNEYGSIRREEFWVVYVKIQPTYNADSGHGEHDRPEEERQLVDRPHRGPLLERGYVREHIVEHYPETDDRDGWGEGGEGSEVLEIADPAEK